MAENDHDIFLQFVLSGADASAQRFADGLVRDGMSRERLFLDLLAGSARKLGEMWEKDDCDFADVTIGLCRLHAILRAHTDIEPAGGDYSPKNPAWPRPRILLATACADQHVLGVSIVADFFRRAGWRVVSKPGAPLERLADMLSERSFDVLGLSASCSIFADDIAAEITALRSVSCNKDLKVLVGGRLFVDAPELIKKVGADGFAQDASSAPAEGEKLLAANALHC